MEAGLVARAAAAASSLGRDLDLHVEDVVVVQNSNTLALRLLPCDVFARTSLVGQEVAAFEVLVAQNLGAVSAPIASLDPRVEPRVYERDDFAVTFWTYYESVTDTASPARYANALHRLHAAMQSIEVEAPHFTERIAAAEGLLTNRHETPALVDADRTLLLDTLRGGREAICRRVNADQLLHGEPHPGNLLGTRNGLLFIDFETCCRGPIEFDVAHVPASGTYSPTPPAATTTSAPSSSTTSDPNAARTTTSANSKPSATRSPSNPQPDDYQRRPPLFSDQDVSSGTQRGARSGSFGCGAGEHSKSRPAGLTGIQEQDPDARKAFTGGPRCTSGYPIAQWQGGRRPSCWHGSTRDRRSVQRRHGAASCPGRRAGGPWPAAVSLVLRGDPSSRNAGKWSATLCEHLRAAGSRLIRPWTCWLAAPTPVCYMGEGLSVWTGRDSKADTRRHAGCGRVHRAAPIRPVGAPRVDR